MSPRFTLDFMKATLCIFSRAYYCSQEALRAHLQSLIVTRIISTERHGCRKTMDMGGHSKYYAFPCAPTSKEKKKSVQCWFTSVLFLFCFASQVEKKKCKNIIYIKILYNIVIFIKLNTLDCQKLMQLYFYYYY